MFATLGFFSLLTVSGRAPTPQPAAFYYRPRIEVWTNRGDDPYASGQAARVSFRTEQDARSEEHTSELQSPCNLVCRLLLEKKKKTDKQMIKIIHYRA